MLDLIGVAMLKELTIWAVSLVLMQFVTQTEGCGVICIRAGVENQVGIPVTQRFRVVYRKLSQSECNDATFI